VNLGAGLGVAVREFATGIGPVDYALFVDRALCGVLEAKPDGTNLSGFSDKAKRYPTALGAATGGEPSGLKSTV
jgi:type I restriction enzyme R subunit